MKRTWALAAGLAILASPATARGDFLNFLDGFSLPGARGWTVDGDTGTIIDLGGGNFGIQQVDDNPGVGGGGAHGGSYDEFYITIQDPGNTLAARFRLDQYSGVTPRLTMLALTPGTPGADTGPAIGIGVRNLNGADRWVAMRFLQEAVIEPPPPELTLVDLGPVVLGQFNEALIHIDNPTDVVRISWNGVEVYNATTPADWDSADEGYAEFGASNYWGEGGTSRVTYDWVGYGIGYVPEPGVALLCVLGGALALERRRHTL
jgi:hypothetical protein